MIRRKTSLLIRQQVALLGRSSMYLSSSSSQVSMYLASSPSYLGSSPSLHQSPHHHHHYHTHQFSSIHSARPGPPSGQFYTSSAGHQAGVQTDPAGGGEGRVTAATVGISGSRSRLLWSFPERNDEAGNAGVWRGRRRPEPPKRGAQVSTGGGHATPSHWHISGSSSRTDWRASEDMTAINSNQFRYRVKYIRIKHVCSG